MLVRRVDGSSTVVARRMQEARPHGRVGFRARIGRQTILAKAIHAGYLMAGVRA
jgi:hypothetical protein